MIDFEGKLKYNICQLAIANHQKNYKPISEKGACDEPS